MCHVSILNKTPCLFKYINFLGIVCSALYYSGIHNTCPCVFWNSRHNFRDIELKCSIFSTTSIHLFNLLTCLIKFIDSLNMTNRAQIHEFYKIEEIFFVLQARVVNFGDLLTECWQQIQIFSTVSPNLSQLGPKTQGHGVNTTIVAPHTLYLGLFNV